ncbi:hypothetical protein CHCC20335_2761 [Bacillus paralicheniformis]|nr:hypothetical protein CHCC20335_2761 [Bacillus paralicheniformis]
METELMPLIIPRSLKLSKIFILELIEAAFIKEKTFSMSSPFFSLIYVS